VVFFQLTCEAIMIRWPISLMGLALVVFGGVGLTGPGRIDIEDGQARYEAGRNIIDHGDTALRDPHLIWNRFPGRDGRDYTGYRFPQIFAAAACVAASDAIGVASPARRHFAFSQHGAACAAMLAVMYAVWFRSRGLSDSRSMIWAALGIFATPMWYYGTSTFDEAITTLFAVATVLLAAASGRSNLAMIMVGLCMAVLYNCKPPIVGVILIGHALGFSKALRSRRSIILASVCAIGLAVGDGLYRGYHAYKFPPEVQADYDRIVRETYAPMFFGNVPEALLDMAIGPSSGVIWYCPAVIVMIAGLLAAPRPVRMAFALSAAAIVGFMSLLVFYKGGPCWGPRYLVPLIAVAWLFAPQGFQRLPSQWNRPLITLSVLVQVMSLTAIPERLYLERYLPSGFYIDKPWWYLRPELGHVFNRPREIVDILAAPDSPLITPSHMPTATLPVFDPPYFAEPKGIEGIRKYELINGFRFWWAWMPKVPASDAASMIDVAATAGILMIFVVVGIVLIGLCRPRRGPVLDANLRE
jgi:hypothetical protein